MEEAEVNSDRVVAVWDQPAQVFVFALSAVTKNRINGAFPVIRYRAQNAEQIWRESFVKSITYATTTIMQKN